METGSIDGYKTSPKFPSFGGWVQGASSIFYSTYTTVSTVVGIRVLAKLGELNADVLPILPYAYTSIYGSLQLPPKNPANLTPSPFPPYS